MDTPDPKSSIFSDGPSGFSLQCSSVTGSNESRLTDLTDSSEMKVMVQGSGGSACAAAGPSVNIVPFSKRASESSSDEPASPPPKLRALPSSAPAGPRRVGLTHQGPKLGRKSSRPSGGDHTPRKAPGTPRGRPILLPVMADLARKLEAAAPPSVPGPTRVATPSSRAKTASPNASKVTHRGYAEQYAIHSDGGAVTPRRAEEERTRSRSGERTSAWGTPLERPESLSCHVDDPSPIHKIPDYSASLDAKDEEIKRLNA